MALFGVSDFTSSSFQNQSTDFDNFRIVLMTNQCYVLCCNNSPNHRKYPCDSFREVGSHMYKCQGFILAVRANGSSNQHANQRTTDRHASDLDNQRELARSDQFLFVHYLATSHVGPRACMRMWPTPTKRGLKSLFRADTSYQAKKWWSRDNRCVFFHHLTVLLQMTIIFEKLDSIYYIYIYIYIFETLCCPNGNFSLVPLISTTSGN